MSGPREKIIVQHNWNNFLWKWLDQIMMLCFYKEYGRALETLFDLCNFIPEEVYKQMEPHIKQTREKYESSIETPTDPFEKIRIARKIREMRARSLISDLIIELRSNLERRGYLERKTGGIFEE